MSQGVTYSSEVADVNEAVFRYGGDVVRERESGVEDETKVACKTDDDDDDYRRLDSSVKRTFQG
jgi:hypothetical protein